jgi:hypothetical protein
VNDHELQQEIGDAGTIVVRPVLFCAPVFWSHYYWADSAHIWDDIRPDTPLDGKPTAELEVGLDATLGDVVGASLDAWGITRGRTCTGMAAVSMLRLRTRCTASRSFENSMLSQGE